MGKFVGKLVGKLWEKFRKIVDKKVFRNFGGKISGFPLRSGKVFPVVLHME